MRTPRDLNPGWKSDPRNERRLRYWDGREWTERSAPTRRETAEKFVTFEEGGAEKPPAVSIQHRTPDPAPRPPKVPDPVPAPTNPGVLATFAGILAVIVGSFGPWTEKVVMNLAVVSSPWVTAGFGGVAIVCLSIYLLGGKERWRDFAGGLVAVTIVNAGFSIWKITHFSDDYPRVAVDATIGWGLWLVLAGALVALAGSIYAQYGPKTAKASSEASA